jgi:hypothetical protein
MVVLESGQRDCHYAWRLFATNFSSATRDTQNTANVHTVQGRRDAAIDSLKHRGDSSPCGFGMTIILSL